MRFMQDRFYDTSLGPTSTGAQLSLGFDYCQSRVFEAESFKQLRIYRNAPIGGHRSSQNPSDNVPIACFDRMVAGQQIALPDRTTAASLLIWTGLRPRVEFAPQG
jgi:hypothetical protein